MLLGVPIVVLTILEVVDPLNTQVILWSSVLHAVFYFYTSFALLRYMFLDRFVTTDELWATGATFTVVAWAFAYTFMAVQVIWPGSFIGIGPGGSRTWFEMLFLSFTNLTSVGLSDIMPVLPQARSWVMIEQVAGLHLRRPGHLPDRRADDHPAARLAFLATGPVCHDPSSARARPLVDRTRIQ